MDLTTTDLEALKTILDYVSDQIRYLSADEIQSQYGLDQAAFESLQARHAAACKAAGFWWAR